MLGKRICEKEICGYSVNLPYFFALFHNAWFMFCVYSKLCDIYMYAVHQSKIITLNILEWPQAA